MTALNLSVIPALSRNPADARLRGETTPSAQGLGLAGFRLRAGMTDEEIVMIPLPRSFQTKKSSKTP
ncbi:hypothetical protein D0C28_04050 [Rhizobium sp. AU243]|nr:hypothetical protein D0C28_04050 [Rhizobium sp. AU243]